MDSEVLSDADVVALRGASMIAAAARDAVKQRGKFAMAVSGGHTPWVMLGALASELLLWDKLEVFRVDERIAPGGRSRPQPLSLARDSALARAARPRAHPCDAGDLCQH
jgi:6-phosphogluconolactonase